MMAAAEERMKTGWLHSNGGCKPARGRRATNMAATAGATLPGNFAAFMALTAGQVNAARTTA